MRGEGAPLEPGDELVAIRGPDGRYLARNDAGEIGWVDDLADAFKYYRQADGVDAQVHEVKRRHGVEWTIEPLRWRPRAGS